jgi:uncharacterized paraquat-inducible protein A
MHKIPIGFAINTVLITLCLVTVFHLAVLSGLVPSNIVWGGKMESESQLIQFEIASITINAFMILVVATKAQYAKIRVPGKLIDIMLWLMFVLFAVNTVGNLLANTLTETIIFTPVTFILALLCFRIAKG